MSRFARLFGDAPAKAPERQPVDGDQTVMSPANQEGQEPAVAVWPLDPRLDLAADHDTWEVILAEARARNRWLADGHTLEELFHFLRCVGVTVAVQQGRQGPYLRLVWEHVGTPEQDEDGRWITWMRPEAFRAQYLEPYRDAIAEHLKHTWEVMQHAQAARAAA